MHILLADREAELMAVLWDFGPSTVAEVRKQLQAKLAYNTVLSVLRTLEAKGYVAHEEEGRAHRYRAFVAREAAGQSAIRHLSAKLFKGSAELLMTSLISDRRLSGEQVRKIRELLDKRTRGDER